MGSRDPLFAENDRFEQTNTKLFGHVFVCIKCMNTNSYKIVFEEAPYLYTPI